MQERIAARRTIGLSLCWVVLWAVGVACAQGQDPSPLQEPSMKVPAASTDNVVVEKIEYQKWKDAWRIRNGACEMVVVPQISRVMHFALPGGKNILWLNEKMLGLVIPQDNGQWNNMGGDKVWPTEQGLWPKYGVKNGWPPPYWFDCCASTVEPIKGGLRLTSSPSPTFGAVCVREFVMDETRPLVHISQWYSKTEGDAAPMTFWTITQVRQPLFAMLPLGGADEKGLRYRPMGSGLKPDFSKVCPSLIWLQNSAKDSQKAGVTADADLAGGWVAAAWDNVVFVESHKLVKDGKYPDGNCGGELYTAPAEAGSYVEMELLSPLTTLAKGQKLRDDTVWQLIPLDQKPVDPEKLAAPIQAAHKVALGMMKD